MARLPQPSNGDELAAVRGEPRALGPALDAIAGRHGIARGGFFFDFGDALVGDPAYDFVTPVTFIVRGRADLMAALLDGYGVRGDAMLRRRFMAYELLHRFSRIGRDVRMLAEPRDLATLADVERALFPFAFP
jgi:hypothetical protein